MIASSRPQRGMALLVVLWACTLLAILLGGYATLARTESLQVRYQVAQAQARMVAEAGVMRAIHEILLRRQTALSPGAPSEHWIGDGKPFAFALDDASVQVVVTDESGKIDINTADTPLLRGLFVAVGLDASQASSLAQNVVDWRTPLVRAGGAPLDAALAGESNAPRHAPFASLEELQAVSGMTAAVYGRTLPAVTVWSHRPSPVPVHAPLPVLVALPGMDLARARQYIALRDSMPPNGVPPALPNGMAGGGGLAGTNAKTILSEGRTADGTRQAIRVTVQFATVRTGGNSRTPPYTILRWQSNADE